MKVAGYQRRRAQIQDLVSLGTEIASFISASFSKPLKNSLFFFFVTFQFAFHISVGFPVGICVYQSMLKTTARKDHFPLHSFSFVTSLWELLLVSLFWRTIFNLFSHFQGFMLYISEKKRRNNRPGEMWVKKEAAQSWAGEQCAIALNCCNCFVVFFSIINMNFWRESTSFIPLFSCQMILFK